jgi:putative transcriptional regulator
MTKSRYRDSRLEVLHRTSTALANVGALDKATMRDLDAFCLTAVEELSGADIRALREREHVSQGILARHLNVSAKLVSDWESGVKRPSGPSLKLLTLVRAKGLAAIA